MPVSHTPALCRNNAENEPFFLGIAGALALSASAPAWGPTALYTYLGARIFHGLVFLVGVPQPIRALAWTAGAVTTLVLGIGAFFFKRR